MTRPRLCILLLLLALAWPALPALAQEFGLLDGDEAGAGNASQKTPAAPAAMVQEEELVVLAAPEKVGLGEPFLVRLTANRALGEVAVYWRGKEVIPSISVWNDRHVALAMLGTDVLTDRPGSLDLVVTAGLDSGKKTFRRRVAVRPKEYATQALNLPEPMVTPPEEVLSRIARERAEVARVLSEVSPKRRWSLPLKRPVAGQATSVYGLRRILNGRPKNPHRGLDFRAAEGLAVAAAADGVAVLVADHYYSGKSLYLDHGNGVLSMYFHLSEALVSQGQRVSRGQPVGLAGMTGRATGPHLHFGVSVQGRLVDPEPLLRFGAEKLLAE